ncbi:MAG: hypothetical protein R2844_00425 [Caldilineales bacterium]
MASTDTFSSKRTTAGDAAVGGLFHGLVAGLAMAVYIVLAGLMQGIGPVMIWTRLGGALDNPVSGLLAHLAVSGVYGVVWGLLWRPLHSRLSRIPAWAAGLVYGLVLMVIAQAAVAALNPLLMDIGLAHRLVAHLVYGLVLGLLTARSQTARN